MSLRGPVSETDTPEQPDNPIPVTATDNGFEAPGPWRVSGVAQVSSLGGMKTWKNLPVVLAGTTPMEIVLVSEAPVDQPPVVT